MRIELAWTMVALLVVPMAAADPSDAVGNPGGEQGIVEMAEWLTNRTLEYVSGIDPRASPDEQANHTRAFIDDLGDFVEDVGACLTFKVASLSTPQIIPNLINQEVIVLFPGWGIDSETGQRGFGEYKLKFDLNLQIGCLVAGPGEGGTAVLDGAIPDGAEKEVDHWSRYVA